jgi:hypothetical protein
MQVKKSQDFEQATDQAGSLEGSLVYFLGVSWKRFEDVLGLLRRSWNCLDVSWYLLG